VKDVKPTKAGTKIENMDHDNSSVREKLLAYEKEDIQISSSRNDVHHTNSKDKRTLVIMTLILRFLFSFSTLIPRANLYLIMEAKYGVSIVTMGYLDSLLAVISASCGFTVGPLITKFYKGRHTSIIFHASVVKVVSNFSNITKSHHLLFKIYLNSGFYV